MLSSHQSESYVSLFFPFRSGDPALIADVIIDQDGKGEREKEKREAGEAITGSLVCFQVVFDAFTTFCV